MEKKFYNTSKDLENWSKMNDEQLYEAAREWAQKYTMKKLRMFQDSYSENMEKDLNEANWKGNQNMWQCVTFAISIKAFGE